MLGVELPSYGTIIFTAGTIIASITYLLVRLATSRARLMTAIEDVSDSLEAAGYVSGAAGCESATDRAGRGWRRAPASSLIACVPRLFPHLLHRSNRNLEGARMLRKNPLLHTVMVRPGGESVGCGHSAGAFPLGRNPPSPLRCPTARPT